MVIPSDTLTARITRLAVGERRSQPRVYLSASRCAAKTGRMASEFCSRVATSLRTLVITE